MAPDCGLPTPALTYAQSQQRQRALSNAARLAAAAAHSRDAGATLPLRPAARPAGSNVKSNAARLAAASAAAAAAAVAQGRDRDAATLSSQVELVHNQVESELDQRELHLVNRLVDQRERKLQRDLERQREAAALRSALLSATVAGGRGGAAVAAAATAAAAAAVTTAATASHYQDVARRAHLTPPLSTLPADADPPLSQQMVPGYHPAAASATPSRAEAAKFLPAKSLPAKSPPAKSAFSAPPAVARGVRKPTLGSSIYATLQRPVLGGATALSMLPGNNPLLSRLAVTEMLQRSAPPQQGAPQAVGAPLLQQRAPQAKGAPPPPRALETMPGLESSESLPLNLEAPTPLELPVMKSPALPPTQGPESPTTVISSPDNVSPLFLKPSAPPHALHLKLAGRPPLRFAPAPERPDKLKCFCVSDADLAAAVAPPPSHIKRGGGAGAEEASPRAVKRACLGRTVTFIPGDVIMTTSPPPELRRPPAAAPAHLTTLQGFVHFVLKCQDTGKLPELSDSPDSPDSDTDLDPDGVESEAGRFELDCEELDSSDCDELEAVARSRRNLSAVCLQRPPTPCMVATHRLPGAPVGAPGAPLRPLAIARRRASGPRRCMQAPGPCTDVPAFAPQLATQL